jgi:GAF domain-containing protein
MALHGRRLDALWKLSKNTALSEDDMTRALLTIAAAAVRPGQPFAAHLLRLDQQFDELVVEETITRGPSAAWLPDIGTAVAVEASLFGSIARRGGTRSCADVTEFPELAELKLGRETGTRSFIASAFRAADVMYVVGLVSTDPVTEPFTDEDTHFMEILTTLLQSRLEMRRHRERLLERAQLALRIPRRAS